MTSTVERGNVKKVSMDRWSTRERLCLASAVFRSGDQNWMSVSRSLRMFGEPNRPPDWFSQKNCAVQYSMLLENVETPKRKKRSEKGEVHVETPGESIVRKLTNERIEELKLMMQEKRAAYLRLKEEVLQVRAGHADDRLADMLREIEDEKKQKEKLAEAHEQWLRDREEKKLDMERNWKPVPSQSPVHRRKGGLPRGIGGRRSSSQSEHSSEADSPISEPMNVEIVGEEPPVDVKPPIAPMPTSPLLTSLLKSPSPAPNAQTSLLQQAITNRGSSPTITSLLSSSPGVPTTVSSSLKNLVSNALSGVAASVDHSVPSSTSPSAGAPTLSMLLEMPPNAPGQPLPELPTTASKPLPPPVVTDDKLRHLQRDPSAIPTEIKNNESVKIVVVEPKSEPVEHIPIEPKEEPVEEELIEEMVVSDDAVLAAEVIPNVSGSITNDVPETTVVTEQLQTIIKKEIKEEYTVDPPTSEPVIQVKMDPDRELLPEDNVSELISTSLPPCITKEEKVVEDAETTNKNEQIASSAEEIVLDKDFEMIIEGTMQELTEEGDAKGDVSDITEVVEFEEGAEVKEVIPPDLADMEVIILGKVNDEVVDVSDEAKLLEVVVEKESSNMPKVQTDVSGGTTSIPVSNEAESAEEKQSPSGSTMELQDANISQSTQDDDDYSVDVCTSSVDMTESEQPHVKQDRKSESKLKSEEEKLQQVNEFTKSKSLRSSSPDSRTEEEQLLQKSESLVSELSTEKNQVPVGNDVESEVPEIVRPSGATPDNKKSSESNEPAEKGTNDKKLSSSESHIVSDEQTEASEVSEVDKVANDRVSVSPCDSKKSTNTQMKDDDKKITSAHIEISDTVCEQPKESKDTLIKAGKKSGPHKEDLVHVTTIDTETSPLSQDVSDKKEVEPSLNQEEHQKKKNDKHKTVDKLPKAETAHEAKTSHAVHREKTICTDPKNNPVPEKKDATSNIKDKKDNKKEVNQQEAKESVRGGRESDKEGKRENIKKQAEDIRKKTDTDKKDVKEVNRGTTRKTEKENAHRRDGSAKRKEDNADEREDVKKRAIEKDDRKDVVSKEGIKRESDAEGSVKKVDSRKSEKSSKIENRKEHKKSDSKKENEVLTSKKSVELPPEPMDVKTVNLQQEDTTESECESEKISLKEMYAQSSTHKEARKTYTETQQENAKGGKSVTHAVRADTPSTEEEKTSDAESTKQSIKKRSAAASTATADSVPSSPGYHTEDEREYKAWKKAIMLVYGRLATHKYASLFLRPITDDQAPGYSSIVHRPMDLLMIKKNIETGMIRTTSEFQRDVLLMFQNSIMYNKSSHFVHKMARQMQQEGMQHIQDFLTTQMLVQVVGEVPLRRETRTTEANKNRDVLSGQEETDAGGKRKRVSGAEVERHKKRKV